MGVGIGVSAGGERTTAIGHARDSIRASVVMCRGCGASEDGHGVHWEGLMTHFQDADERLACP